MLNLPLMEDTLALRLVGTDKRIDGWIDRAVLNPFPIEVNNSMARGNVAAAPAGAQIPRSNREDLRGGRASLLAQPNDRFSATLGYMHQEITQDGSNTIDGPPFNQAHYQPFDVAEPFSDRFNLVTLTLKYNFDSFQLLSASADRKSTRLNSSHLGISY